MIKLSFIVPVYNVAPYLRKCVDSLLAQDYDDYEIILVDDGSTDDSPQICDEYAASPLSAAGTSPFSEADHSIIPIRVIHQENGGLSAARNAGIKCAEGKYLCFVDSDDYWEENVLGGLMGQVERENLDVLRFDYQNVRVADAGHLDAEHIDAMRLEYEVFEPNKTPRHIDRKNEIVDGETYLNTRMGYACYAVMFIIRRDMIGDSQESKVKSQELRVERQECFFAEGIHFEDVDWLPRMMLRAKRVNSTQTIVYNYFVRQGSITKTQGDKEKIRKNLEDRMKIIETYSHYIEQYPSCHWLKNMQSNMAVGILTTVAQSFYQERKENISRLKALNVFPLSLADQGKTFKRRARIIDIVGPRIYCMVMHYAR
mgnify:CR=1 FL=1